MKRPGLLSAAAIVVAANAAAWAAAAWNRSGEPEAVLVLTERELRLPPRQAENTALALSLVFEPHAEQPREEPREAGWFDRAKLESIGFDCGRPVSDANAEYYRTRVPRSTFAALEFEGDTWRKQVEQSPPRVVRYPAMPLPDGTAGQAPRDPLLDTHLVPIDVDNDPAALRARHPDRRAVAIVEATVALRYVSAPGQPPFLEGRVTTVLPRAINVPREWRSVLTPLQQPERRLRVWPPPPTEPRFRATIAWGKRLEPRVTNVELIR